MPNYKYYRKSNKIKNYVQEVIADNKRTFIALLVAMLFGIIVSLILTLGNADTLTVKNLLDRHIIDFISGSISAITYFFYEFLKLLFTYALVVFFGMTRLHIVVDIVIISYESFLFSFNFTLLIITSGLTGFIFALFTVFLKSVILTLLLLATMFTCHQKYKSSCPNNKAFKDILKTVLIFFGISLAIIILNMIIIKFFCPILLLNI
ncbi:MAG: hypothetical protein KBT30_01585 [Clostridiales bacterium]|nr:hypothetical protein [Candidatus Apopatousia equi]